MGASKQARREVPEEGPGPRSRRSDGKAEFFLGRAKEDRTRFIVQASSPWADVGLQYDSASAARLAISDFNSRYCASFIAFHYAKKKTVSVVVLKRKRRKVPVKLKPVPIERVPIFDLFNHTFPGHEFARKT